MSKDRKTSMLSVRHVTIALTHAKILAIANQKGGVGKTTTTLTLGTALAKQGKNVLILDLDPHACASLHMKLYPEEQDVTLHDLLLADASHWAKIWQKLAQNVGEHNIHFAAGSIRLSELELDLQERKGKGMVLSKALVPVLNSYDFVLLDCPPHVGILLVNALVASDLLIIPIQTDFLALHGLKLLFDTLRTLNKILPIPIRYKALPTMYDKRARACTKVLELMRNKMGEAMFETVIGVDTRFREASALGTTIYQIAPDSRGAIEYNALSEEVLKLW